MDPNQHHNALNHKDMLHWYEIQSILGQGGFGITYLARDMNLDQLVAIKEYLPTEFSTRDQANTVQPISENHTEIFDWGKKRFLDEAKTLAQFRHPNVVRVSSFFENNNTGYMVMDYEDGTDLSKLIKAGESFDEQRLLGLLLPVLDGLDKIHAQGFIHRDIKPANIFISTDGSPVLIDFGSARQAIGEQTRTMTSLVTPGYAPFEQYHDADGKQGPWTDIYALGATCYCMLTGKPPIDALKRGMARIDHSTDAYLPLVDLRLGDYSEQVLQAIDHALEFREADRPQNVNDWSAMLRGELPVPQSSIPTRLGAADIDTGGDTRVVTAPGDTTGGANTAAPTTTAPTTAPDAPTVTAPPRDSAVASTQPPREPPAVDAEPAAANAQPPAAAAPAPKKSGSKAVGFLVAAIVILLVAMGIYWQAQQPEPVAVEPATVDSEEQARIAAEKEALRVEQARLAAEAKRLEEEKARIAAAQEAAQQEAADQARLAAEAEAAEQARLAAEQEAAQQARLAAEQEAAQQARLAAEQEAAEQARLAAEQQAAQQARLAAEQEAAEQARIAAEKAAQEQARLAAEAKKREQEKARIEAERKRKAEEKKRAEALALQQQEQESRQREQALQEAARNPFANVSGRYRPDEGFEALTLLQVGNRISGEIGTRGSTIEGRRNGNKITFVLKYSRTGYGFKEGFGEFTISADGRRLTGYRSEAGFPPNSAWNFTRRYD